MGGMAAATATVTSGLLALAVCALLCDAAPARSRVTTDQRQKGELNIRAELENVLILVLPSSNTADLLSLAGLKRAGLLQALLSKKNKYDTEVEDHNDINTEYVAPGDLGQEEVVATVEEMKPQTTPQSTPQSTERATDPPRAEATEDPSLVKEQSTKRATDPPRVEATEDPSLVKEQSTVGETVRETVISITSHEEPKQPVKVIEDMMTKDVERSKEKEDAPAGSLVVDINPKPESHNIRSESPTKEDAPAKSAVVDINPKPESHNIRSESPTKEDAPAKSAVVDITSIPESNQTPETQTKEDVSTNASTEKSPEEDKLKESLVKGSVEPTIADLIKPVSAKEENSEESTSSKKTVEEDKSLTVVKKVGAAETRREKALKYQVETKWAPGLVGLLGPQERGRYAGLCAPGRWDPELRTCLMPGETRSRAELARFLGAMRFGIVVPTK